MRRQDFVGIRNTNNCCLQVTIECEKTGYSTELEFKLRPFLGGGELTNAVAGRLKLGKETLATIDGHWDEKVVFKVSLKYRRLYFNFN